MTMPRAVIFGIDGADWLLLDPLLSEGALPHLMALRARSAFANLTCTWPAHTAPGWASLLTARYPGRHGVYQFFSTQEADYGARITTSAELGPDTVFDWLGARGWTSGIVNVPMTHPPRRVLGYQITWPLANTLRFSDPPELLGELARTGAHFKSDLACMYRGDLAYVEEAIRNVEDRKRSVLRLLATRPTDAVMVVVTELDRVAHHYWHFSDPGHPAWTAEGASLYRDAIRRTCIAIDAMLGAVVAAAPDAVVVVVSDHGMGPGFEDLSVNRWLEETGFLATKPRGEAPDGSAASWFRDGEREIDWDRTRAYCPVPGSSAINVNLRGRQRLGTVAASSARAVRSEVEAAVLSLRYPGTGAAVVARALAAEDFHLGPFVGYAPDLVLVPSDERIFLGSHVSGPLWRASYQTGVHRHVGMWMQSSAGIAPGPLEAPLRIVDVVPTLIADLGLDVPRGLDGVASAAVLGAARRPAVTDCPDASRQEACGFQMDDVVTERLRAMGYL